jgi:hypothetical protein
MSLLDLASLVLAPTATKEGKVYSAIPNTGDGDMTFSRGSAATRVNSAGLIEKERANFLFYSQDFSDSNWVLQNNATITHNITDPNGGTTASRLSFDALTNSGLYQQQLTNFGTGSIRTASIYLKGTVGGENVMIGDASNRTRVVLTTDWVRYEGFASDNSTFFIIYTDHISGASSDTIEIAFAQYENGLVAQSYIETTTTAVYEGITDDVPRVDYSGGGCPSLLLEGQRTNLITQSEYIDSFTKSRCTIIQNSLVSPEGLNNAAKITQTTSTAWGGIVSTYAPSSPATLSVFAKKIDNDFIAIIGHNSNDTKAYFDLANGTVGTIGTDVTSASIEDFGNGWYRCIMTATTVNRYTILHSTTDDGSTAPIGSETALWGCQLESSASYVSSYIPTYGVSSTRVADSCSKTGISELIGQTEGTFYVETKSIANDGTFKQIAFDDGTTSNLITIDYTSTDNQLRSFIRDGGTAYSMTATITDSTAFNKIAIKAKNNDFAMWVNGTEVATSATATYPNNLSNIEFNNGSGGGLFYGNVKQMILFPTALTDTQLEELTK